MLKFDHIQNLNYFLLIFTLFQSFIKHKQCIILANISYIFFMFIFDNYKDQQN
jgi:hypothetical protein